MKFTFSRFVTAVKTVSSISGSPTSAFILILGQMQKMGLRSTISHAINFVNSQDKGLHLPSSKPEILDGDHTVFTDWQTQSHFSKQLAKNNPNKRVGQPMYEVSESKVGLWLKTNLRQIIEFNPDYLVVMDASPLGGNERFVDAILGAFSGNLISRRLLVINSSPYIRHGYRSDNVLELGIDSANHSFTLAQKIRVIKCLIYSVKFSKVLNFNSRAAWEYLITDVSPIPQETKVYTAIYCPDYDFFGREMGYSKTHFPSALKRITGIITDNYSYPRKLLSDQRLEPTKSPAIFKFDIPSRLGPNEVVPVESSQQRFVWIGRDTKQKGLGGAIKYFARMENAELHVFSDMKQGRQIRLARKFPKNVVFHGELKSIQQLINLRPTVYLNTSLWDGTPNVLIEMLTIGLPVLSTPIPGVQELSANWPMLPIFFIKKNENESFQVALGKARDWQSTDAKSRKSLISQFHNQRVELIVKQVTDFFEN